MMLMTLCTLCAFALDSYAAQGVVDDYAFCGKLRNVSVVRRFAEERIRCKSSLLKYLSDRGGTFCASEDLCAIYDQTQCSSERLLEDVVELIEAGHNIVYDHRQGQYMLKRDCALKGDTKNDGRALFLAIMSNPEYHTFAGSSVAFKTYCFYACGCLGASQGTLAVFQQALCLNSCLQYSWCGGEARLERLLALKDEILKERVIRKAHEYKWRFPQGAAVSPEDIALVTESLKCFARGREILYPVFSTKKRNRVCAQSKVSCCQKVIMDYMETKKGDACDEEELRGLLVGVLNKKHFLYEAIIGLRRVSRVNIVHDADHKQFTLHVGVRPVIKKSWKKKLWNMFDKDESLLDYVYIDLAIILSDLGYDPSRAALDAVKLLKRLVLNREKDKELLLKRRRIWDIVRSERTVNDRAYYAARLGAGFMVTIGDVVSVRRCWSTYQHIFGDKGAVENRAEIVMCFLKEQKQGVTLEQIGKHLHQKLNKVIFVWHTIRFLMCNGYAHNIDYDGSKFIWKEHHTPCSLQKKNLLEDILDVVKNTQKLTILAFCLYKRGHNDLRYPEIKRIMDVLVVAGVVSRKPFENVVTKTYDSVINEGVSLLDLAPRLARAVERLLNLQLEGVLQKIKNNESVCLRSIVKQGTNVCRGSVRYDFDSDSDSDSDSDEEDSVCSAKRTLDQPAIFAKKMCKNPMSLTSEWGRCSDSLCLSEEECADEDGVVPALQECAFPDVGQDRVFDHLFSGFEGDVHA